MVSLDEMSNCSIDLSDSDEVIVLKIRGRGNFVKDGFGV